MANTTWNSGDKTANCTLTGGNLIATSAAAGGNSVRAVDKQVTGKFYWECTCNTITGTSTGVALYWGAYSLAAVNYAAAGSIGTCGLNRLGTLYVDGTSTVTGFGTIANGTVVCVAFDADTRLIWFRLGAAGNWNNTASANPATGTGGAVTSLGQGIPAYPTAVFSALNDQITANFGDTAFTGAVPSGFTSGFPLSPGPNAWSSTDLSGVTLSGGNLIASSSVAGGVRSVNNQNSGKWYFEQTINAWGSSGNTGFGIGNASAVFSTVGGTPINAGLLYKNGGFWINNISASTIPALVDGDTICHAIDLDARLHWVRKGAAGLWNNQVGGNPATGAVGNNISSIASGVVPTFALAASGGGSSCQVTANFGATTFIGAVPSGYTAGFGNSPAINTNALATQAALEQWITTNPPAQVTQVAIEEWASVATAVAPTRPPQFAVTVIT